MSKTTAEKIQDIATRLVASGEGVDGAAEGKVWISSVVLAMTMEGMTMAGAQDALVAAHKAGAVKLVRVDLAAAFDRDDLLASELVLSTADYGDEIAHFLEV